MKPEQKARLIAGLQDFKYPLPECGALSKVSYDMWVEDGSKAEESNALSYFGITEAQWLALCVASMLYMPPAKLIEEIEAL
jgi:hypothetical protein